MRKILFLIFLILFFVNPAHAIKIGLQTDVNAVGVAVSTDGVMINARTNRMVTELKGMKGYLIVPRSNNRMLIKSKNGTQDIDTDRIVIKPTSAGFVCAKRRWYRGILIIQARNNALTVINDIDLENYLKGVIPAEMPSNWDVEAHKAQAIAARSYALANLGKHADKGYDLNDTPQDQAYGGASAEKKSTTYAVKETEGIVLTYDQKIISAYYTSSAGGQTKNSNAVWGKNLPYIRSVPSYDGAVGKKGHGVGMSQHGANNLAKKGYNAYQILKYFYKDVSFARLKTDV